MVFLWVMFILWMQKCLVVTVLAKYFTILVRLLINNNQYFHLHISILDMIYIVSVSSRSRCVNALFQHRFTPFPTIILLWHSLHVLFVYGFQESYNECDLCGSTFFAMTCSIDGFPFSYVANNWSFLVMVCRAVRDEMLKAVRGRMECRKHITVDQKVVLLT